MSSSIMPGSASAALAVDTDVSVYDRVIAADLIAPIHLTQACLPHLVANRDGMVVAISSVAGRAGVPLRTAYCAAKHGIIGYMDALRAETEIAHGLHVMTVLPGSVATDVARNALTAHGAAQGHSDPQIDGGIPVEECAAEIVAGMKAGARELIVRPRHGNGAGETAPVGRRSAVRSDRQAGCAAGGGRCWLTASILAWRTSWRCRR